MRQLDRRWGPWWVAVPALLGAAAALLLPGASSTCNAEATLLAVGALAFLAGHTWGLFVIVPAHVILVGRLWPEIALYGPGHAPPGGSLGAAAIATVLVSSLPALALAGLLLPGIVSHLVAHRSPRQQAAFVGGTALILAAALVLPAL